jgi:hypothetical protein
VVDAATKGILPLRDGWRAAFQTVVIIAYGALSILRAPKIFAGRFRAEEGIYYGLFQHGTVFKNLFLTGPGYPVVLTNASVLVAGLLPVEYVPLVTTAIGFAVQVLLAALVILWHDRIGLNLVTSVLIVAALIVIPHSAELYASTSKMQWLVAMIDVLILIDPGTSSVKLSCTILFVGALSGIAPAMLLPAFMLKWWIDRSRASIAEFTCLAAPSAAILIIGRLFLDQHPARSYPLNPDLYLSIISVHSVSEFFGFDTAVRLSQWYARSAGSIEGLLVSTASVALIGCGFAFGVSRDATRRASLLLAAAYCGSAIIGIFGALDPQELLAKPFLRYLFLPNVILLLLIGHLGSRLRPWIGVVALAWVVAVNTPIPSTLQAIFFDGPSWRAQIPAGGIKSPTTVNIWPPGWTVTLTPR